MQTFRQSFSSSAIWLRFREALCVEMEDVASRSPRHRLSLASTRPARVRRRTCSGRPSWRESRSFAYPWFTRVQDLASGAIPERTEFFYTPLARVRHVFGAARVRQTCSGRRVLAYLEIRFDPERKVWTVINTLFALLDLLSLVTSLAFNNQANAGVE